MEEKSVDWFWPIYFEVLSTHSQVFKVCHSNYHYISDCLIWFIAEKWIENLNFFYLPTLASLKNFINLHWWLVTLIFQLFQPLSILQPYNVTSLIKYKRCKVFFIHQLNFFAVECKSWYSSTFFYLIFQKFSTLGTFP